MKDHSRVLNTVVAVVALLLYIKVEPLLTAMNLWLGLPLTAVFVCLLEYQIVWDAVKTCREQHRFAWNLKNVRTDVFCLLGATLLLWGVFSAFYRIVPGRTS